MPCRALLITSLLLPLFASHALPTTAGDAKLKRGVEKGVFVDEYFGLRLEVKGLQAMAGKLRPMVLMAATADAGLDVVVSVSVTAKFKTAADVQKRVLQDAEKAPKKPSELEHGKDPRPWVSYVTKSLAGFERHVAEAWYMRKHQIFTVRATAKERTDSSLAALKAVIHGLRVDAKKTAYAMAHIVAADEGGAPNDPAHMLVASLMYIDPGVQLPKVGLEILLGLEAKGAKSGLDEDETCSLATRLGIMYGVLRDAKKAESYFTKALALAEKTGDPDLSKANVQYNRACNFSLSGDMDKAHAALRKAFEGDAWDFGELRKQSRIDASLAAFRKDKRFEKLFKDVPIK